MSQPNGAVARAAQSKVLAAACELIGQIQTPANRQVIGLYHPLRLARARVAAAWRHGPAEQAAAAANLAAVKAAYDAGTLVVPAAQVL